MLEIGTARSGNRTARIDATHVHSPYDPQKEARRFVRQTLHDRNPSIILLLGAGLGYLYEEMRRSYPAARILVVFYSESFPPVFAPALPPDRFWQPSSGRSILQFLRSQVHDIEAEGLATVEWPPCARLFPHTSATANRAVQQLLREIRGSLVTTSAWGRLWLKNSLYNFLGIDRLYPPVAAPPVGTATIIAASGPTLARSVDLLIQYRSKIELWALPSSLLFLLSHGLFPDTVILTDPGYYAFSHLRCAADRPLHLTMPLSAARGVWRIRSRVSLLCQDTPFERMLLEHAAINVPRVPSQGTVSATAMLLALAQRKGPVVLAGLDFRYQDILSHVRPNNFENWLEPRSHRLLSLYHQLFALSAENAPKRGTGGRISPSLDTYAGWFAGFAASQKGSVANRVYRLFPSSAALPGIREIGQAEARRLFDAAEQREDGSRRCATPLRGHPSRREREKIVEDLLRGWIENTERIAGEVHATASLAPLWNDSRYLSMLYLCNAAKLTEMRRTLRLQGIKTALQKTAGIFEEQEVFLKALRTAITGRL